MWEELTEEKRMENLEQIMKFMDSDMSIKKIMEELAPRDEDLYSEGARIDYLDKQNKKVQDIEFYFSKMIKAIPDFRDKEALIKTKIKEIKDEILKVDYSEQGVKNSHQKCISNMSPKLIERVKTDFFGYSGLYSKFDGTIEDVKSFNELLHVMHSYVTNNQDILETMPIVDRKEGEYAEYTLYGKESEEARKIFDSINPETTKAGTTQILALDNKILMMVRDRGHALTLDIDTSEEKPLVNYFVPKVTNRKMVSQLRGVYGFDKSQSDNAVGKFQIEDVSNIGTEVIDFVENVPGDEAMRLEGGKLYEYDPLEDIRASLIEQAELDAKSNSNHQVKNNEDKWLDRFEGYYEEMSNVRNLPENRFSIVLDTIDKNHSRENNSKKHDFGDI